MKKLILALIVLSSFAHADSKEAQKQANDALANIDKLSKEMNQLLDEETNYIKANRPANVVMLDASSEKEFFDDAKLATDLGSCAGYAKIMSKDPNNDYNFYNNRASYYANASYQNYGIVFQNLYRVSDKGISANLPIIILDINYSNKEATVEEKASMATRGSIDDVINASIGKPTAFADAKENYAKDKCETLIK